VKGPRAHADPLRGVGTEYGEWTPSTREPELGVTPITDAADAIRSVAAQLAVAIRRTRKFGLGFCFATQEISSIAKSVFRGLGTRIFAYGLKAASEAERVKEVVADESAFRLYRGFPDPKSSGRYMFMVTGAAVPFANGAPVVLTAFRTQEEFFSANHRLSDPGETGVPEPPPLRPATAPPATGIDHLAG
jgi:hypothetical protein